MTNSSASRSFFSSRTGRIVVAIVVIGTLFFFAVVSSFSGQWSFLRGFTLRTAVDVMEAESRPSDRLRVGVASCNADPEVVLFRETDDDVQIKVVSSKWPFRGGADDCQDGVIVQLQQPLGDRVVVDKHTGQPVNVRRGMSVIEAELRSTDRLTLVFNCNTDVRWVLRQETDIDVQVMMVGFAIPSAIGDVCRQIVEFRLREPLGDRVVVDMHTELPVSVRTVD
ncbi:MAG: hypothetical protein IIC28_10285 [Chloroflexi bacterium]|nr:hypothetical protein [Chloroflexota bacterium]